MKRILMICLTITLLLCGCTKETPQPTYTRESLRPVEHVGTVPAEFQAIVEENPFRFAAVFPNRLVKSSISFDSTEIRMYDHQGQLLLSHRVDTVSPFGLYALTTTSDGGFLYVLGFQDFCDYETGQWASENGLYSLIRKFSADGQQEWETRVDGYTGWALRYCIEQDDGYYFFGSLETPETKTLGVVSPDDISIVKLSSDGQILQSTTIGGSDYDQLQQVQEENGNFIVYGRIQSFDGDFADSNVSESVNIWKITIDSDLNILSKTTVEWRSIPADPVGFLDGRAVTSADIFPDGFADGRITGVLDYGDFFLVVSENNTGYYPTPPQISAQYYYTETVYGAYDKAGNVIWKATVDSTPHYPANLKCDVQYADSNQEIRLEGNDAAELYAIVCAAVSGGENVADQTANGWSAPYVSLRFHTGEEIDSGLLASSSMMWLGCYTVYANGGVRVSASPLHSFSIEYMPPAGTYEQIVQFLKDAGSV